MKTVNTWAAAAAILSLCGSAQAALHARDGGMVYDDVNDITWLADMNYAKTSGHDSVGLMDWSSAKAWAENLNYGGYSDWRLPTLNAGDTSCSNSFIAGGGFGRQYYGTGCTGGELSHLFVADLGNKPWESVLDQAGDTDVQKANLALFSNTQSYVYWSGTEYAPYAGHAWYFCAYLGSQQCNGSYSALYAVAVRPGDVAAVPEPQTYALLLAGLGVVGVALRKRPR